MSMSKLFWRHKPLLKLHVSFPATIMMIIVMWLMRSTTQRQKNLPILAVYLPQMWIQKQKQESYRLVAAVVAHAQSSVVPGPAVEASGKNLF